MDTRPTPIEQNRPLLRALLAIILAAAAYFRLARLGVPALRADTINFWNICQQDLTGWGVVEHWMELMGRSGHFPFANAFIKWFLDTFNLPLTHFTIRLPSALWGIFSVAAAFGLGRSLKSVRLGLILASLAAVNPFLIQNAREAYFYAPLLLGSFLVVWSVIWIWNNTLQKVRFPVSLFFLHTAGCFLLVLSHPSGLSLGLLVLLVLAGLLIFRWRREGRAPMENIAMLAILAVMFLPMFTQPWGFEQLRYDISAEHLKQATSDVALTRAPLGRNLFQTFTIFGWGNTPGRILFGLAVLGCGCLALVRAGRTRSGFYLVPGFLLSVLGINILGLLRANLDFDARYVAIAIPLYLAAMAMGLDYVSEILGRKGGDPAKKSVPWPELMLASALGLWVYPAYLCTRLTGSPTPYKDITAWVDAHLPPGTLVLVDRWFEPWNELKIYPATNAYYTFTVPNEPLENFIKLGWRDTAVNFFEKYPDAAFLEIAKTYWPEPRVGPWLWPRQHFAKRTEIRNEAGLRLRQLGLAMRSDFYAANTNRTVVDIFYNQKEDILNQARQAGKSLLVLYGPGWGYTKTQDYRDWRILQSAAQLQLCNLTDGPLPVRLLISAMAYAGTKQVRLGSGEPHTFAADQLEKLQLGPVQIPPGQTDITLVDQLWDMNHIPLLVDEIELQSATENVLQSPEKTD